VRDRIDGKAMKGSKGLGNGGRKRGHRKGRGCLGEVIRVEKDRGEGMEG
jgi:hypothetical protein